MLFAENDSDLSDEELQEAFAAGLLKPGLNIPTEAKTFKNNVSGLKLKKSNISLNLPWIERLDINSKPAHMAPEMFHELSEKEKENVVKLKTHFKNYPNKSDSLALDDFKREMLFHRQAQAALIEGVSRLAALGIPTKRPDDYFAEMAKSDQHMHKIRESLSARQAGAQRAERISQLRRQKKLSKQTQVENKLKQAQEKKHMLNEVKKFRKGIRKDLSFLDGSDKKEKNRPRSEVKRKAKDQKFGFGGKKRGLKRNTKDSFADVAPKKSGKPMGKGGKSKPGMGGKKRLGKSRRVKSKGRR